MANILKHNLSSKYLEAASLLSPRKQRQRIVAYVESYDDIAFWRTLLSEFENEDYYFSVMLPCNDSLAKGKKVALTNLMTPSQLGHHLIACVDSDYDFLLQGATHTSKFMNESPFVLQTYAYAIESYHCYAESLRELCVRATLNDRFVMDFPKFFKRYSEIIYPLFIWNVYFYRQHDTNTFTMHDFNNTTTLRVVDIKNTQNMFERLEHDVNVRLHRLENRHSSHRSKVKELEKKLIPLGLLPENTYLDIQGHHLHDNVVMKLLNQVCTMLRREREDEIKRLATHSKQFQNEMTCYENSQAPVALMLKKNEDYKSLFLYQWMREDVRNLMEQLRK